MDTVYCGSCEKRVPRYEIRIFGSGGRDDQCKACCRLCHMCNDYATNRNFAHCENCSETVCNWCRKNKCSVCYTICCKECKLIKFRSRHYIITVCKRCIENMKPEVLDSSDGD